METGWSSSDVIRQWIAEWTLDEDIQFEGKALPEIKPNEAAEWTEK